MKPANVRTKKELANLALKEFVENYKRKNFTQLKEKIKFAEGYDYKSIGIYVETELPLKAKIMGKINIAKLYKI